MTTTRRGFLESIAAFGAALVGAKALASKAATTVDAPAALPPTSAAEGPNGWTIKTLPNVFRKQYEPLPPLTGKRPLGYVIDLPEGHGGDTAVVYTGRNQCALYLANNDQLIFVGDAVDISPDGRVFRVLS